MSGTVLADVTPTARKQHVCELCGAYIEPGEQYRRCVITDDNGGVYVWKDCALCRVVARHVADWAWDDGYGQDSATEWALEHRDERGELGDVATAYLARVEATRRRYIERRRQLGRDGFR